MSKNVFDIGQELMSNAYPGRGIILTLLLFSVKLKI